MAYTHLKPRSYYENLYDHHTVESARRDIVYYEEFHQKLERNLPEGDKIERPGNAFLLNVFYMEVLGNKLLDRYNNRETHINEWMARDEAKDTQVATARLTEEPYCQHCSKQGLRIIDKSLMHRGEWVSNNNPDEVLFMLRCPSCKKTSAFWEDGTAWKIGPTLCPKCQTEMTQKTTKTKKAFVFTYTCPSCRHSYKEKMDLTTPDKQLDPNYDQDRITYCLLNKEFRDRLISFREGMEAAARLGKELKEKEDNKHIYDAIKDMKKPKIAELSTILSSALEPVGYIEFSLDKPDIGKDVIIGFSCLDGKNERSDYDSEKTLKKTIDKALADTNWRLMSDGIHYRLGYLSGRLRAYEREEDLKALVMKSKKLKLKKVDDEPKQRGSDRILKTPDGKEVIL